MKTFFILAGLLYLLISLAFVFAPELKRYLCFKHHKKLVAKRLYKTAKEYDNLLINKFNIAKETENIEFDHVFFGNKYIYCIRDERFKYGIQGNSKDLKWSNIEKDNEEYINNPLLKNTDQVSSFKKHLGIGNEEQFFFSIICVNDNCELSIKNCGQYETVIKLKDLKRFILSKEKDKSVGTINQNLLENTVKVLYQQCQQDLRN